MLPRLTKVTSLFSFLFLLALSACKEDEDPSLNTPKVPFTGSLKTNGYYFLTFSNGSEERALIYFLYRDGTLLYGGAPLLSSISAREADYASGQWSAAASGEKTYWGVFKVNENNILFDQWYLRDGGLLADYQTNGSILNDSSFIMTSSNREGLNGSPMEEVYRFKALPYKPDSVNQFLD